MFMMLAAAHNQKGLSKGRAKEKGDGQRRSHLFHKTSVTRFDQAVQKASVCSLLMTVDVCAR